MINAKFCIYNCRSVTLISRELASAEVVNVLKVILLDWITGNAGVISYNPIRGDKVLSFHAPADLTWHASDRVLRGRLVVDGGLLRAHLVCKEASIGRLVDARFRVF